MRFLLSNGGEVHLMTFDFTTIDMAISYDTNGNGDLLCK